MPTYLMLECSGCGAKASGRGALNRAETLAQVTPEGWVWREPYTRCTYCPACWAAILEE